MRAISSRPEIYALIAAVMNGSIGTLTRVALAEGIPHQQIAFMKCFMAFLILFLLSLVRREGWQSIASLRDQWPSFILLSFLGVFCLYFFETWAFDEMPIPIVSFLTYAAGGATLCLSVFLLGERLSISKILAFSATVAGIYLIYAVEQGVTGSRIGMGLALLGGLGYALFLVMSKYLKMKNSIAHLVWLFGGGSLFLLLPALHAGFIMPGWQAWIAIVALVVIPTIGGFYFTTKAIRLGEASTVQIIETSDPVFASLLGFLAFNDVMSGAALIGAVFILSGLLLAIRQAPHHGRLATTRNESS